MRGNYFTEDVMSRLLSYLRRGLLGIAFVGSLGFGATQAFASPEVARTESCELSGSPYIPTHNCDQSCPWIGGYCDGRSWECTCWSSGD